MSMRFGPAAFAARSTDTARRPSTSPIWPNWADAALRSHRLSSPASAIPWAFVPGVDLYADPGIACSDFRGSTIIPGIGHWVQQEAPDETNAALEAFVRRL